MDILVKVGDFIPKGWYFRSWTGRIMKVHTKGEG